MSVAEVRQASIRDFMSCVDKERVPSLSGYLRDYVKSDCTAESADYRLMPLTATTLRFVQTGSDCLTDCMFELQAKYELFVPDGWGGRMERGWRDIGVIGFNIEEGITLDIQEINQTTCHEEWADTRLACLDWERLLVHAVVDFGRFCGAKQVTLHAACGDVAKQSGFAYDNAQDCSVLQLDE